jgi:hypothetical protein
VDLGTSNIDLLPPQEALEALARYRVKLEENVKGYHDLEQFLIDTRPLTAWRCTPADPPVRGELRWLDDTVPTCGPPCGGRRMPDAIENPTPASTTCRASA